MFVESLNQRIIVLHPDSYDLANFLDMISKIGLANQESMLDAQKLKSLMDTMDTEWDRKVARVFLSANRSRARLEELGIDFDKTSAEVDKVCT